MGLLRSEIMVHKQIRIPKDIAFEVMDELGKMDDAVEFVDLNKDDQEAKKNFGSMIRRCDEMETKINNFEKICDNYNEKFVKYSTYINFITELENDQRNRDRRFGSTYFDLIENEIIEDEKKILELIHSYQQISETLENLVDKKSVFDKASQLLLSSVETGLRPAENLQRRQNKMLIDEEIGQSSSELNFIAGVIKAEDDLRMKRMIFRNSKGRAIPTFFDLVTENKMNKSKIQKKIFTVFFQGGVENVLLTKLLKICDIFGASRFNIPKREEIQSQINQLQNEIYEKKTFLKQAETSIKDFFRDKIGNSIGYDIQQAKYEMYRMYFKKERLIFLNLNKCILRGNFIDGEVWIPEEKYQNVQENLQRRSGRSEVSAYFTASEYSYLTPPTYIKTNDFTASSQLIVDTYGIPRYREINPALFNIVTFPFLFGVMFGDIGHGLLLALFGLYLIMKNDELNKQNSQLKPLLKGRYLLFFMGLSAFYMGWIYNDFLSIPLGIFGTCYNNSDHENSNGHKTAERVNKNCVYPFGLDPKWYVASNELAFMNSMKMKLSVIIGVLQMLFGIILKGANAIYFKSQIDFIFEFIPQLVFMSILFGYMGIMIIIKWTTDWSSDLAKAPLIISQLMNIFLKGGDVGEIVDSQGVKTKTPLWGLEDYHKQENFHMWILIIAAICVPIMLFPKPICQYMSQTKTHAHQGVSRESFRKFDDNSSMQDMQFDKQLDNNAVHVQHSFGEIFIHQAIETIEFVLSTVSNTASYLRLWALSLAHGQLAKVFFSKFLLSAIQEGEILKIFFGFFQFANATFSILMQLDLMECFLHTLRLHWVEFQNKFYKADGYKFNPFCFKYLVEARE